MSELHELLAVESDLKGEAKKIKEEAANNFSKKTELFRGGITRLEMFDEGRKSEELEERTELTTTVQQQLDYMSEAIIRNWDLKIQKEMANQMAKAEVEIDGLSFAKDVPVTFLLAMEDELKQLRQVYDKIPTLQPGISWVEYTLQGEGIYKAEHPVVRHKTEKTICHKILVPPTKEHPAQIREWSEDKPVGNRITEAWSGMISPAEKSMMLGRIDKLLRAFKKARQRANNQETTKRQIGQDLFNYIHNK